MVSYAQRSNEKKPHKYSIPLTDNMLCTHVESSRTRFKLSVQVARALKNMTLPKAELYLNEVIKRKKCIPITMAKSPRTQQINHLKSRKMGGYKMGRWPNKASRAFLELIEVLKNEADKKGFEAEKVVLKHLQVNKAPLIYGRKHRAFGRVCPYNTTPCHIEVVGEYRNK